MHRWVQRTGRRAEAACGERFIGPVIWPVGLPDCTALARSGERIPETQDSGKQGSLEDGGELGWAGLRD